MRGASPNSKGVHDSTLECSSEELAEATHLTFTSDVAG